MNPSRRQLLLLLLTAACIVLVVSKVQWGRRDSRPPSRSTAGVTDPASRALEGRKFLEPRETAQERTEAGGVRLSPLTVLVTTETGAPLEAAEIEFQVAGTASITRRTNGSGLGALLLVAPQACRMRIHHPGYATEYRFIQAPYPELVRVQLARPDSIAGSIELSGGRAAPPGVLVVAWPIHRMPTPAEIRAVALGGDAFPSTTAGPDGHFSLSGLTPGGRYCIIAAAGAQATEATQVVGAGVQDVRLKLSTFYGIVVEIRGQDGQLPQSSPILYSAREGGTTCLDHEARAWPSLHHSPLTGLLPLGDDVVGEYSPFRLVSVFVRDSDEQDIGPIRTRLALPGYLSATVEGMARRLDVGIARATSILEPTIADWSAIELRFAGLGAGVEHSAAMPPLVGRLRDVVRGNEYEFEIYNTQSPLFVGALPQSTYDLRVTSPSGLPVFPESGGASRLTVGSELVAIDVHLERMASVHIALPQTGPHSSFDGPIVVEIVDERGGSSYVDFLRAPYHFSGIPHGKYRLKCTGLGIPTTESVIEVIGGRANEWRIEF